MLHIFLLFSNSELVLWSRFGPFNGKFGPLSEDFSPFGVVFGPLIEDFSPLDHTYKISTF